MPMKSFSVRMYLQDGDAGGVKVVSKSKWAGRGLVIPRASFVQEKDRDELKDAGVYVLVGDQTGDDRSLLIIGAGHPVCEPLLGHDISGQAWSVAVIFTCKENSLKPEQLFYIVSRLHQLSSEEGESDVGTTDNSKQLELSAQEKSTAEVFLAHMLSLYPLLGVNSFSESRLDI